MRSEYVRARGHLHHTVSADDTCRAATSAVLRLADRFVDPEGAVEVLTALGLLDEAKAWHSELRAGRGTEAELDALVREAGELGLYESTADPKETR